MLEQITSRIKSNVPLSDHTKGLIKRHDHEAPNVVTTLIYYYNFANYPQLFHQKFSM